MGSLPIRITLLAFALGRPALAQSLSPREARMREYVAGHHGEAVALLEKAVNIGSGTLNLEGVRAVGALFRDELDRLGFGTRWAKLPPRLRRAGHLVAERRGSRVNPEGKRLLLIGHLDTVFEGPGQRFVRRDTVATGAGTADMKGGNVTIILALRALAHVGALDEMNVIVVLTGDEESAGRPLAISRRDLIQAARRSDAALAFEGGGPETVTIARRGVTEWILTVKGQQAHSSGMFQDGAGYGAVFEAARILDAIRARLAKERYVAFNPGAIVGGTDVTYDSMAVSGKASSKTNIVARTAVVQGDLRYLTKGQFDSARAVIREIVADNLPGTSARISIGEGYPGMPPTDGNRALLAVFDRASRDLGYPPVLPIPPERRGGGDIAFVADIVPSLDGLGVSGFGAHSPDEGVYLPSLKMAAERAAVLMARLAEIRR